MNISFTIPDTVLSGALTGLFVGLGLALIYAILGSVGSSMMNFGNGDSIFKLLVHPGLAYAAVVAVLGGLIGWLGLQWWGVLLVLGAIWLIWYLINRAAKELH